MTTQVAAITPVGRGAVATIVVSGKDCVDVVNARFRPAGGVPLGQRALDSIAFGSWSHSDSNCEDVVIARRTKDCIEIHCHGGVAAVHSIVASLVHSGCRQTSWQDLTRAQTESPIVADAIVALSQARTVFTAAILLAQQRSALQNAIAQINALVDTNALDVAVQQLQLLNARSALGIHTTQPWNVVLSGPPNVGKSSLINALAGFQRAIVFDQPGTTRDVVTAETAINGWPVRLLDTAGIRRSSDHIESISIERSRETAQSADLLLLIQDSSQPALQFESHLDTRDMRVLRVANKIDLLEPGSIESPTKVADFYCSAKTGSGIPQLLDAIAQQLWGHIEFTPTQAIPFTQQHADAIELAIAALNCGDTPAYRQALISGRLAN